MASLMKENHNLVKDFRYFFVLNSSCTRDKQHHGLEDGQFWWSGVVVCGYTTGRSGMYAIS